MKHCHHPSTAVRHISIGRYIRARTTLFTGGEFSSLHHSLRRGSHLEKGRSFVCDIYFSTEKLLQFINTGILVVMNPPGTWNNKQIQSLFPPFHAYISFNDIFSINISHHYYCDQVRGLISSHYSKYFALKVKTYDINLKVHEPEHISKKNMSTLAWFH